MSDLQFYPTPSSLAYKAYNKFKNKSVTRLLEPSAGRGDLLAPFARYSPENIDCIELDFNNQAILRSKGFNVIDADFMQFEGAAMYSHLLLNPPFFSGVEHVIKAFDLLINGELVAIINADTIKNPYTKKRKLLVDWIGLYGDVEFIESAFTDPDTQRKTSVEVALIWMQKTADIKQHFTTKLEIDNNEDIDHEKKQGLALRGNTIGNAVAVFNAAVSSLRSAVIAQEEADYYRNILGVPLNRINNTDIPPEGLQTRFNKAYDDLKDRAWANILKSTEFSKYLSSKAYDRLTSDFASVKKLNFTEINIRGFLLGLVESQGDMNIEMLLDCFDEITKYIPENRAYYRGWKSNQKHKDQAFRVQMTRFIIPRVNSYYSGNIAFDTIKKLSDFDKVFAMLEGKAECAVSLGWLFSNQSTVKQLERGERLSTTYFDVRYYPGVGTIHFFPTNKAVIDRLNKLVGKQRQWLPQDETKASKDFWNQYDQAEKVTRKMVMPVVRWGDAPVDALELAHLKACETLGIDLSTMLTQEAA
ncbi:MAG: DUF4942 domain-containing protein [Methylococcaceae bacterium]|nr:DUF4942 domain-containing protein [Methylococcaceae bacterium]